MSSTVLLLIDPQNDFCDFAPSAQGTPALPVAGADADMQRVAALIGAQMAQLDDIVVTLDSHHRVDVAHPSFWQMGDGAAVGPFTPITAAQVRSGALVPRDPAALPRVVAYLDELEAQGRYTLMVWPVHCEIGTWGHNVHAAVRAAYNEWEVARVRQVRKVVKGTNPWTEHYSAMQAEVPDASDPDTQLNRALIAHLDGFDTILIAGEASSHCVKATTEHLAQHLPSGRLSKLVLLTDGMSAVTGFEAQAHAFIADMVARGARTATCADVSPLF